MSSKTESTLIKSSRLAVAVIGGYLFTNGFIGAFGAGLHYFGMIKSDAMLLALISGFLIYHVVIIWVISARCFIFTSCLILGSSIIMIYSAQQLV